MLHFSKGFTVKDESKMLFMLSLLRPSTGIPHALRYRFPHSPGNCQDYLAEMPALFMFGNQTKP